jgi:hypothetical protein
MGKASSHSVDQSWRKIKLSYPPVGERRLCRVALFDRGRRLCMALGADAILALAVEPIVVHVLSQLGQT